MTTEWNRSRVLPVQATPGAQRDAITRRRGWPPAALAVPVDDGPAHGANGGHRRCWQVSIEKVAVRGRHPGGMLVAVTGSAPAWRTALGELPIVRDGRWGVCVSA